MNYFTQEELKQLEKFEQKIMLVIKTKSCSSMSAKDAMELYNLYVNRTGNQMIFKPSCSHCLYNLLEKVGNLYLESKKQYETKEEEKSKKVGRPKKETNK